MDLLIMNPGSKSRPVKRRRKNSSVRKSRSVGVVSMKGNQMKVTVRRRKARKNPTVHKNELTKAQEQQAQDMKVRTGASINDARMVILAAHGWKGASKAKPKSKPKEVPLPVVFGEGKKGKKPKGKKPKDKKGSAKNYVAKYKHLGKKAPLAMQVINARKPASTKKAIARKKIAHVYMAGVYAKHDVLTKKVKGKAAADAQAYGLLRLNPSTKAIVRDAKILLPVMGVAAASAIGGLVGGVKLSAWATEKMSEKTPAFIRNNIAPLATGTVTAVAFAAMKKSRGMQRWAMPVLVGGGIATVLQMLLTTVAGQKLAKKMGLPMQTLGDYIEAPNFLGAMYAGDNVMEASDSFYSRRGLSDYVGSGPQEAFGDYAENDFPIHSPMPRDDDYTMAALGELIETPDGTMLGSIGRSSLNRSSI